MIMLYGMPPQDTIPQPADTYTIPICPMGAVESRRLSVLAHLTAQALQRKPGAHDAIAAVACARVGVMVEVDIGGSDVRDRLIEACTKLGYAWWESVVLP